MAPWHLAALRCGTRHVSAAVRRSRSCCSQNHGVSLVPSKGWYDSDKINYSVTHLVEIVS